MLNDIIVVRLYDMSHLARSRGKLYNVYNVVQCNKHRQMEDSSDTGFECKDCIVKSAMEFPVTCVFLITTFIVLFSKAQGNFMQLETGWFKALKLMSWQDICFYRNRLWRTDATSSLSRIIPALQHEANSHLANSAPPPKRPFFGSNSPRQQEPPLFWEADMHRV